MIGFYQGLSNDAAMFQRLLTEMPSLKPVGFDKEQSRVIWKDLPGCSFTHAFFDWSVRLWETQHGAARIIESDLDDLKEENLIPNTGQPSGFIFHMSRCGSTALSKALAQSPRNLVISEPDAVNGLIYPRYAPKNCKDGVSTADRNILVNLLRGLGHDQNPDRRFFVKFSSWNVLLVDAIREIFPATPRLFMYRDPRAVMTSLIASPAGFSEWGTDSFSQFLAGRSKAELEGIGHLPYIAGCLGRMMDAALADPAMGYLNHTNVNAESLPMILRFFGVDSEAGELADMERSFVSYSKTIDPDHIYQDDRQEKERSMTPEIRELADTLLAGRFKRLESDRRNLIANP